VHPDRFSDEDPERLQEAASRGPGRGALEAVLAEHRRARRQAVLVRELVEQLQGPVAVLPFVFPPATDREIVRQLAGALVGKTSGPAGHAQLSLTSA
jgi:hypothetical protein